jgi:hypothetical protein
MTLSRRVEPVVARFSRVNATSQEFCPAFEKFMLTTDFMIFFYAAVGGGPP